MCTAITIQTTEGVAFFGRTMDFIHPLDPELYLIPKGYRWHNAVKSHNIENRYSVLGIGQNILPIILTDGVNEMGVAAAALYFPGYAQFDSVDTGDCAKPQIAAVELVNFLLGQCASVEEAKEALNQIRVVGVEDSVTDLVAPLHWMVADRGGNCVVVEKTADGLHLMENAIGVLTNSPDFGWHMANLRNYMNVTPSQRQEADWGKTRLTPFGQGAGTFGLPGDFTPPSRFVRTAYLKSHTSLPSEKERAVVTCFHIMESISIPKGAVISDSGEPDYTQYTAFCNLSTCEYFFRTYENSQIVTAKLPHGPICASEIISLGKLATPVTFEERPKNFQ